MEDSEDVDVATEILSVDVEANKDELERDDCVDVVVENSDAIITCHKPSALDLIPSCPRGMSA